jgi:hypothetical protein
VTTSVLDKVPVDQITAHAREVHFWRSVLTVIAAALFGLGWVTAKAFAVLWLALAWSAVAVKMGWQQGRAKTPAGPSGIG